MKKDASLRAFSIVRKKSYSNAKHLLLINFGVYKKENSNILTTSRKLKIFNDPIYGFITIPNPLVFDLIAHPYFQRLRRISQMGLSYLVYPGAHHTRFHHALGSMHLMQKAVQVLRFKGVEITKEEENGLYCAILLHDIGHGPFSHAMEHSIVESTSHEFISLQFMESLNKTFKGKTQPLPQKGVLRNTAVLLRSWLYEGAEWFKLTIT